MIFATTVSSPWLWIQNLNRKRYSGQLFVLFLGIKTFAYCFLRLSEHSRRTLAGKNASGIMVKERFSHYKPTSENTDSYWKNKLIDNFIHLSWLRSPKHILAEYNHVWKILTKKNIIKKYENFFELWNRNSSFQKLYKFVGRDASYYFLLTTKP